MGNTPSSSLPFNVGGVTHTFSKPVPWQLHEGTRKENAQEVSIFRLPKAAASVGEVQMAIHALQKLRTMRHPNVLSFIEGLDDQETVILVTERVLPLRLWLRSGLDSSYAIDQISWGLRSLAEALCFLHNNCHMLHGALSPDAIFVTSSGDWKLGGLELVVSLPGEKQYFADRESVMPLAYRAPERQSRQWELLDQPDNAVKMDMFALGRVIEEVFEQAGVRPSAALDSSIRKLLKDAPHQRIMAQQFSRCPAFKTDFVSTLAALDELTLKSTQEQAQLLSQVKSKIASFPAPIATQKIGPSLIRVVELAVNDFASNRESAAATVSLAVPLLAVIAAHVPNDLFVKTYQHVLLNLWTLNARGVRSVLLHTLPVFAPKFDDDAVNKRLFDPLLNGFGDSAVPIRELTLKSLVCITDRLEEKLLNDRLLRCLNKLQSDLDPGIRTNTTIFVGKIASKLKSGTRTRALPAVFLKAMKDPFSHARLAGVKSTQACISYFDAPTLATKFLPALSCLTADNSAKVREAALDCIEHILQPLRVHHAQLAAQEQQERAKKAAEQSTASSTTTPTAAATHPKPAPKAVGLEPTSPANFRSVHNGNGTGFEDDFDAVHLSSSTQRKLGATHSNASAASFDGWDDFDGLDDDDNGNHGANLTTSAGVTAQADGWGDDDDDDDGWGSDNDSTPPPASSHHFTSPDTAAKNVSIPQLSAANRSVDTTFTNIAPHAPKTSLNIPLAAPAPRSTDSQVLAAKPSTVLTPTSASGAHGASAAPGDGVGTRKKLREKAAVKKLAVENDDWDDF